MIELLLAAERMLADGLPDQAERLFAQVAEADPQNAIAVVGLARVALTRGDQEGAGILARRALEIDPENAAAQHLVDTIAAEAAPPIGVHDAMPYAAASTAPESPVATASPDAGSIAGDEPSILKRLIKFFLRR